MTATAIVGPGDILRVTYHGREIPIRNRQGETEGTKEVEGPFTFYWDAKPYVCEPEKETFVPFDAVAAALGDPRSGENVQNLRDVQGNNFFVADRASELRRLRSVYDNWYGSESQVDFTPRCTVTDLEGQPVVTVVDDPEGKTVTPAQVSTLDQDELLKQIARQNRALEILAKDRGIDLSEIETIDPEASEPSSDEIPDDTGSSTPRTRK